MNKKIKIAVNTRFLISNKLEGIGTYSHQVLKRLVKQMPEVEFHFLFDRQWSEEFIYADNVIPHKIGIPARHPFLWYLWFEFSITKWLKNNKVDLFLSLDSFLSLKTDTKSFVVMHDLAYEHFPNHNTFWVRNYYKHFFPKYARKAHQVFAVSKFTKQDIVKTYNIDPLKINLAYCGVSSHYESLNKEEQIDLRKELTNSNPYFICIGSLNPRKNINKAIQAFNLFKEETNYNYKLVIVGAEGWKAGSIFREVQSSKYKEDIIFTGHLDPKVLSRYLASAKALIFPSLFEGFGIPIVEAYKCQVPVITSNVSSTKEIGEGVAVLVDPNDEYEIKDAMLHILNTKFDANKAIEKLEQYSWDKTAEVFKLKIENLLKP